MRSPLTFIIGISLLVGPLLAQSPSKTEQDALSSSPSQVEPPDEWNDDSIEAEWVPEVGRYRRLRTSPAVAAQPPVKETPLPPPEGVIVLYPGGRREEAAACPANFDEVTKANGWRFCLNKLRPGIIPRLWSPSFEAPIAGVPYDEARAIYKRHLEEFLQLPGITGTGLGPRGLTIWTLILIMSCALLYPKPPPLGLA